MRRVLPLAVLALLTAAPAASADCCTYEPPRVGDLIASPDSATAYLSYDALDLGDDAVTHGGAVAVLQRSGPAKTVRLPEDPDATGVGLPTLTPLPPRGVQVTWTEVATGRSSGPTFTAPLEGTRLGTRTALGTLPLRKEREVLAGLPDTPGTVLDAVRADDRFRLVVVDDAGATRFRELALDGTVLRDEPLARKGPFRASGKLDGVRVTYLAAGRKGRPDVFSRTIGTEDLGPARNLTRTGIGETYVGGQALGTVAVYGRGRALFARRVSEAREITIGPAQERPTQDVRVAGDGAGGVWIAYLGRGKPEARTCGALVVQRLAGRAPGPLRAIAPCSVGTTV